jgi:hypothetical protein
LWWRVAVEVGVEPVGDGSVGQLLVDPPGVDLLDHRPPVGVDLQLRLVLALRPLRGNRMFVLLREVAVWRLADVPALTGVFLEAIPRLLQHLDHVPLGHALLGAAQEDLSGALAAVRLRDRLVGGQQRHPG